MADLEQMKTLNAGVETWNRWRTALAVEPDLSGAELSGRDLSGADLSSANLRQADLRGADLRFATFSGADLYGATLRGADLRDAILSGVKGGLLTEQLAGSDLTGASLPEPLQTLLETLQNANSISNSARNLFFVALGVCLYCCLTIAK